MSVTISLEQLARLAPNARSSYRSAFTQGGAVLAHYEINTTPLRLCHFMAQVLHESGGLTNQFEDLNYRAERLAKVWPKRFKPIGPLEPREYDHEPEKLANEVYGQRNGNTLPDDGYRYRGRGLVQLTGRGNYEAMTRHIRKGFPTAPDFVAEPDLVISAEWSLHIAAAFWHSKGCNAHADRDSIRAVTKIINGALIGIKDREDYLIKAKAIWLAT